MSPKDVVEVLRTLREEGATSATVKVGDVEVSATFTGGDVVFPAAPPDEGKAEPGSPEPDFRYRSSD